MSAHVLLKLFKELGKVLKCEACQAFYNFFAPRLIKSIKQERVGDSLALLLCFLEQEHYSVLVR